MQKETSANTSKFEDYIASKQKTIGQIKMNTNFTESEKKELIAQYQHDISVLNRLQLALMQRELRRTKQRQLARFHKYETSI